MSTMSTSGLPDPYPFFSPSQINSTWLWCREQLSLICKNIAVQQIHLYTTIGSNCTKKELDSKIFHLLKCSVFPTYTLIIKGHADQFCMGIQIWNRIPVPSCSDNTQQPRATALVEKPWKVATAKRVMKEAPTVGQYKECRCSESCDVLEVPPWLVRFVNSRMRFEWSRTFFLDVLHYFTHLTNLAAVRSQVCFQMQAKQHAVIGFV